MWDRREREYAQERDLFISQVRAGSAAPSEATASEADMEEFPSLEDLENDETWKEIGKNKRRILVGSQRFAKQVKVAVSGFSKVSAATSPFKKKA